MYPAKKEAFSRIPETCPDAIHEFEKVSRAIQYQIGSLHDFNRDLRKKMREVIMELCEELEQSRGKIEDKDREIATLQHQINPPCDRLQQMDVTTKQWSPIEAAFDDETIADGGRSVLLYAPCRANYAVAYWDEQDQCWYEDFRQKGMGQSVFGATHWMPLPEPPEGE